MASWCSCLSQVSRHCSKPERLVGLVCHSCIHKLYFCFPADHIDERTLCNAVAPTKDVDGFHVVNVGRMCLDQSTMLPATPWGVWEIINRTGKKSPCLPLPFSRFPSGSTNIRIIILGIPTLGKNVVVAGRSKNVGMPIAMLLHTDGRHERPGGWLQGMWVYSGSKHLYVWDPVQRMMCVAGDATVTISHRYTPKEQLRQHTKIADIVVAAAGSYPRFFFLDITALNIIFC